MYSISITTILLGSEAADAGAWPRGEGNTFVSLKYEDVRDRETVPTDPKRDQRLEAYLEHGVTPRVTFGAEIANSGFDEDPIREARFFVAREFWTDGDWHVSGEIGLGHRRNETDFSTTYVRPGFAIGRGFEAPPGAGWAELSGSVEIFDDGEDPALRLDTSLGLNLSPRFAGTLQLQASDFPDTETALRAVPGVTWRLNERFRIHSEAIIGLSGDKGVGGAVAFWMDF